MNTDSTSTQNGFFINLAKLSRILITHGTSLILVSILDLGFYLWFLIMVIIESNSGKYTGEAGWAIVLLWMVLIMLLPIVLVALYYLIRGIRFIWTGNRRTYKKAPLDSRYLIKAQHSAILQIVLLSIEVLIPVFFIIACILSLLSAGLLQYLDFGAILPSFILLHIGLLIETIYFYKQLRPSKR